MALLGQNFENSVDIFAKIEIEQSVGFVKDLALC